ncbi:MAG: rRNA (uracil1498-N3)-methyltransferase [Blastocatellia bacterium]|jgi:16S rRNA (uracil1498-N3)-methyltransferase|nr:rRNA (uracil1498-N3)-methyltransferase [Blastocatellia bacterium]
MTRRRFYAPPTGFAADEKSVTLSAEETRHARDVLRLQAGEEVSVFNGTGREFLCTVQSISRNSTTLSVVAEVGPARPESPLDLTLAIALLKGEKFDLVIQKTIELGVKRIVPLDTERADVRFRDGHSSENRLARWRRIALEAAKQTGRAYVPEISEPVACTNLLTSSRSSARLMFSEREGTSLSAAALGFGEHPSAMIALVGPEGGWSDNEIETARAGGWGIVTLGGRILRAETAGIAVVTLLQHRFGDLV